MEYTETVIAIMTAIASLLCIAAVAVALKLFYLIRRDRADERLRRELAMWDTASQESLDKVCDDTSWKDYRGEAGSATRTREDQP